MSNKNYYIHKSQQCPEMIKFKSITGVLLKRSQKVMLQVVFQIKYMELIRNKTYTIQHVRQIALKLKHSHQKTIEICYTCYAYFQLWSQMSLMQNTVHQNSNKSPQRMSRMTSHVGLYCSWGRIGASFNSICNRYGAVVWFIKQWCWQ